MFPMSMINQMQKTTASIYREPTLVGQGRTDIDIAKAQTELRVDRPTLDCRRNLNRQTQAWTQIQNPCIIPRRSPDMTQLFSTKGENDLILHI